MQIDYFMDYSFIHSQTDSQQGPRQRKSEDKPRDRPITVKPSPPPTTPLHQDQTLLNYCRAAGVKPLPHPYLEHLLRYFQAIYPNVEQLKPFFPLKSSVPQSPVLQQLDARIESGKLTEKLLSTKLNSKVFSGILRYNGSVARSIIQMYISSIIIRDVQYYPSSYFVISSLPSSNLKINPNL